MKIAVPPVVLKASALLTRHGFQAYVVGGALRDTYLGRKPTDWDITTDATPNDIERIFERSIPTGRQFGTMTVLLDGDSLEITTMRSDGPYSDGRHPDYITLTNNIHDDLSRRDFTINAVAYDPISGHTIDPFSGLRHLRKRLLVTVGKPEERFQEDPLRMLRLVRFQATLGFKIEKKTRLSLPGLARLISQVSPERVLSELSKMLLGRELLSGLHTLYASDLMDQVLPELAAGHKVSPGNRHPYDLLGHAMTAAHFAYPSLELRWAALLHDIGKLESSRRDHAEISAQWARNILRRLRAKNDLIDQVAILIAHHMFAVHPHSSDREIRRFLAQVGSKTAMELIKLRQADMAGMNVDPREIISFGQALEGRFNDILDLEHALSIKDLCINGHYLMETLDLEAGPIIGEILQYLLEKVWDDPSLNDPRQLERLARSYLKSSQQNRD